MPHWKIGKQIWTLKGGLLVCWGSHNKAPTTENNSKVYFLTVLETGSSRYRYQEGCFLLRAVRKNLLHVFLLSPGGLLAVFGVSHLVDISPCSLPSSSCGALYEGPVLSKFPSYKVTSHNWVRTHPNSLIVTYSPH